MPCSLIEAASSCRACSSKTLRGCQGLGLIKWTGISARCKTGRLSGGATVLIGSIMGSAVRSSILIYYLGLPSPDEGRGRGGGGGGGGGCLIKCLDYFV